ncbi:unnamed protein product [Heterobilharzia americana]|nr:unnamed protein product [Heterobilharzia americana]
MNDNSSLTINQSLIAVGDDEVTEIGSFINFKLAYEDNRYVIRFNDSGNLAELILGCGSAIAFHLVSHEGEESYIFDLFHPSLCGIHQSVLYTLVVILICCSVLIVGYCILSCLLKRCLYRRSWYESIPYIDTFENLNNRLKDYIVLHCHRRQTHLIEPVYMPVPSDSPDHGTNKKHGSLYDDLVEQKQKLLLSNSSDEQQDDILLAL